MRRPAAVALALAALLPIGLTACGGGDDRPGVSPAAEAILVPEVDALRAAARLDDRAAASLRLAALRTRVDRLLADKALDADAARRIRRAAEEVESRLTLLSPPTTTTTTTTTTRPGPPGHGEDKHGGKPKGDKQENDTPENDKQARDSAVGG